MTLGKTNWAHPLQPFPLHLCFTRTNSFPSWSFKHCTIYFVILKLYFRDRHFGAHVESLLPSATHNSGPGLSPSFSAFTPDFYQCARKGSRWWLKCLRPCHPHKTPRWRPWLLISAWPDWNDHMWHLSSSLFSTN